jgi:glucosylceramidase
VATFVLAPGAEAAGEWLTVAVPGSLTRKVSRQADLPLAAARSEGVPQVTVDTSQTRQTMEGFGGAMTQSAAWLLQQQAPVQRKAMLNALFSPSKASLNFVCVPLGASDLSTEEYDYDPLPFFESTDSDLSHFSVAHDDADLVPTGSRPSRSTRRSS